MKKSQSPLQSAEGSAEEPVVLTLRDPTVAVRSAPWIRPEGVPTVPDGFVAPDASSRPLTLTYVAEGNRLYLVAAVEEVGAKSESFVESFGEDAPEVGTGEELSSRATEITTRILGLTETVARLERATAVAKLQLAVAVSDGHDLVKIVDREVSHRVARRPKLRDAWPAVLHYASLHAQDVNDGKARARKARAQKAAAKPAEAKPAETSPVEVKLVEFKPVAPVANDTPGEKRTG